MQGYWEDEVATAKALRQAVSRVGAKRVVLDTLEVLFGGLSNHAVVRSELRRLFGGGENDGLAARGVVASPTVVIGIALLLFMGLFKGVRTGFFPKEIEDATDEVANMPATGTTVGLGQTRRRGVDLQASTRIGERWSLLVLRELMLGPRRFSELRGDLPGISANVLAQRLGELEAKGLVRRTRLPPPASVQVYEATQWGLEAEPVIQALGRWAARSPAHNPQLPLSGVSILLSFRTMLDPQRARGINATIGFRFGASDRQPD